MTEPSRQGISPPPPRISLSGSGALLVDGSTGRFEDVVQRRIWEVARRLAGTPGVVETALAMNNVLVLFDPFTVRAEHLTKQIQDLWATVEPLPVQGKIHEIPVVYGGAQGEDLRAWAEHCKMSVVEVVGRHAAATYIVAAIGGMAGFPYLSGLDPSLAWPRRATPKASVAEGSVIVGATQASIMPITAPSGWHIVGKTDIKLFDPHSTTPSLMAAGDTVRFVVTGIEP